MPLQIKLSNYKSVKDNTLAVKLRGSYDLEDFCSTPYKGGTACAFKLVGSSVPGQNDGLCCPSGRIIGREARKW